MDVIEKRMTVGLAEWQVKLDGGYDPVAAILSKIPPENIIHVNTSDPESMSQAIEKIGDILEDKE